MLQDQTRTRRLRYAPTAGDDGRDRPAPSERSSRDLALASSSGARRRRRRSSSHTPAGADFVRLKVFVGAAMTRRAAAPRAWRVGPSDAPRGAPPRPDIAILADVFDRTSRPTVRASASQWRANGPSSRRGRPDLTGSNFRLQPRADRRRRTRRAVRRPILIGGRRDGGERCRGARRRGRRDRQHLADAAGRRARTTSCVGTPTSLRPFHGRGAGGLVA